MCHLNKAFALPSIPYGSLYVYSISEVESRLTNLAILQHVEEHLQRVCVSAPHRRKGATLPSLLSAQIISNSLCSPDR